MTVNVFLDTEFTSLDSNAKLISIALITEDGKHKFYAELSDTYSKEDCSEFVIDNVLPLLDAPNLPKDADYKKIYAKMALAEVTKYLGFWFASLIDPVYILSDAVLHDWPHIQTIFSEKGLPYNLSPTPKSIIVDDSSANAKFRNAVDKAFSQRGIREHHAMDDVEVIRLGWLAMR